MNPGAKTAVGSAMKSWVCLGVLAAATSLSVGCATISPDAAGVGMSLVGIRPVQTSLFETSAELTLRFTNESSRPLAISGSTHRLFVNGSYVGRAVTNQPLTIPQLGTMTQTMTAHFENLALMRKMQELGQASAVEYRIDSQLHADEPRGAVTLAAATTGQLDLSGFLPPGTVPSRGQ